MCQLCLSNISSNVSFLNFESDSELVLQVFMYFFIYIYILLKNEPFISMIITQLGFSMVNNTCNNNPNWFSGSRSALLNTEARTVEAEVLSRRCVMMRLADFSYEKYQKALRESAGAVVIILPQNMSTMPQDIVQVTLASAGEACGTFSSLEADCGVFWVSSVAVHGAGAGAAGHGDHRARVLRSGGRGPAVHLHTDTDLLFLTGVFISCWRYFTLQPGKYDSVWLSLWMCRGNIWCSYLYMIYIIFILVTTKITCMYFYSTCFKNVQFIMKWMCIYMNNYRSALTY